MSRNGGDIWRLPGPNEFAQRLTRCPLRYVLADELVRICVELAYSEGDDLSSCLDLIHFPAEELWLEWSEPARRGELARALPECTAAPLECVRGGVWIAADTGGRAASMRTFWLSHAEPREPVLAPGETIIDLDHAPPCANETAMLLEGATVGVRDPVNPQLDMLLRCAGFRLDPGWCRYYASVVSSEAMRDLVIARTLGGVAFDVPWVLALFMLMQLRVGLTHRVVSPTRLNVKRARLGRTALLEHIEVSCPLLSAEQPPAIAGPGTPRQSPRLHHVRGHLVRREDTIFWRRPHWRGHLRLGCVRSRTVRLRAF
ncbi:MAG TPA: hypothetical protein VGR92_00875 [Steroidobacteraceae bacterium]|nr:hypothetical protein [Steroidobacteraceae bacterium]